MDETVSTDKGFEEAAGRVPFATQLPTAQQVAAGLAILALVGPAALGGMPVLPVTIQDEQRRRQDEIQQVSESSVGVYQTSAEASIGLVISQQRLAQTTKEVEGIHTHDVSEQDVVHAANRVFANQTSPELGARFRTAFNHVVTDTVDLFILQDNEGHLYEGAEGR